jgi:hypothetical protein
MKKSEYQNQRGQVFEAESAPYRGSMNAEEFNYSLNISLRYRYVYLEAPKVACSTIKNTLINAELGARMNYADFQHIHLREYSPLLCPKQVGNLADFLRKKPYIFCFVRNPYDRLLSAYLDKISIPGPYRTERLRALGVQDRTHVTFCDFVNALERHNPSDYDAHWRPQYLQTCYEWMNPDFVGRFESLERDLGVVLARIGVNFAAAYQAELRHRTQASALLTSHYTSGIRERVQALYRSDFELFEYPI